MKMKWTDVENGWFSFVYRNMNMSNMYEMLAYVGYTIYKVITLKCKTEEFCLGSERSYGTITHNFSHAQKILFRS